MSGQTLTDRIAAAQYQLTGSDVARAVCKATTHEVMAPKKKHLEYLIAATNETNVNIPQMADTLFERAMNASWVVVFKALVTTHHMCIHGNERFIQYLASRNSLFNLSNFIDKTGTHGYDMSTFIRRYARYLNEKAYAYRAMAFDFTRVKKGADGVMRTMAPEKLLKAMPALQTQVDTLLEFDVHPKDLNNGIINGAFMLLFKDLIKLFASYNDGIINLLEKYFKMKKSDCKESLEIYKKFLTRVTKISEFMKIAEQVGVDKNDIPDISYAPSSILESLETHMNSLEGKKGEGSPTKGSPTNNVSPTSTPSKSGASVPTLEPPPTEAAAASASASAASAPAEPATDSLLDLDPLSSSGPPASSAPTSWGDLLGSEFGSLTTETLLPDSTPAVDSTSPATAVSSAPTGEGAASVAPPSTTAGPTPSSADLLGDAFGSSAAEPAPAVETGGSSTVTAPAADASAANDLFAPAADCAAVSPHLDMFSMQPVESSASLFGSVSPVPVQTPLTSSMLISPAPAAPTIDLFSGFFDSMPEPAAAKSDQAPSLDLFSSDVFSPPPAALSAPGSWLDSGAALDLVGDSAGAANGQATAPAPATSAGGDLMGAFGGLGDMLMPAMAPQPAAAAAMAASPVKPAGGDLDSTMASLAGNLGMGTQKPGEAAGGANWQAQPVPSMVSPLMGSQLSFGMHGATGAAPMMFPQQPMMRPQFPSAGAPAAPMSSGMTQSPRKPPPPKDPLADLNIKDFL
ncbi:clathrin coat assembly protein AP180-like isoform X2 [Tachysurus fulvidraco]|uniref:clathrin coat assembly protein AP180-like isoform X2 n=1 Tax=Tachysurus fulvidraco TaxID=1234273 RepID=UPI001FEF1254|nr:clathrin coat assembly protein AP180-like isoform X2 [Tachysurus fulvidraco]